MGQLAGRREPSLPVPGALDGTVRSPVRKGTLPCRSLQSHARTWGQARELDKYTARWQTVKDHVAFLTKTEKESTAQYRPSRPIRIEAVHAHGLERHRALGGGPANFLKALPALQGAWSLSPGQFCPVEPRPPQTTGKAARCPCFP